MQSHSEANLTLETLCKEKNNETFEFVCVQQSVALSIRYMQLYLSFGSFLAIQTKLIQLQIYCFLSSHYIVCEPIKIHEFRQTSKFMHVIYKKVIHTSHHLFFLVEVQCRYQQTTQVGSGQCPRLPISGTVRCTPNMIDKKNQNHTPRRLENTTLQHCSPHKRTRACNSCQKCLYRMHAVPVKTDSCEYSTRTLKVEISTSSPVRFSLRGGKVDLPAL